MTPETTLTEARQAPRAETAVAPAAPTAPAPGPAAPPLRVAWAGELPGWLATAAKQLPGVELVPVDGDGPAPDVVHAGHEEAGRLGALRRKAGGARIVLDLSAAPTTALGWRGGSLVAAADIVLAGSLFDLRELRRRHPKLAPRTALLRQPVDLDRWGPEAARVRPESREARRFKRYHRLVADAVLFAGPFTPEGGLDLAIAAMAKVRATHPETRLLALPLGEVSGRYLDRCERSALAFGHHGLVEWEQPPEDELPLWFDAADVVCLPYRDAVPSRPAWLAAAAARPVVAAEVPQLLEHVADGSTGRLVPAGDVAALAATISDLLANPVERHRLGQEGRPVVERERSPENAAHDLRQLWAATAGARPRTGALPSPTATGPAWPALADETPSPRSSP